MRASPADRDSILRRRWRGQHRCGRRAAIENPDHAANGKAYGFHAERAGETGRFAAALERLRAAGGGAGEVGFGGCPRVDRGL